MEPLNKVEVRLISSAALRQAMAVYGLIGDDGKPSPQMLADLTERKYGVKRKGPRSVGRTIISLLVNDKRTSVSPNTAAAIEGALGVTPGSLFMTKVLPVSQVRNARTEAA